MLPLLIVTVHDHITINHFPVACYPLFEHAAIVLAIVIGAEFESALPNVVVEFYSLVLGCSLDLTCITIPLSVY